MRKIYTEPPFADYILPQGLVVALMSVRIILWVREGDDYRLVQREVAFCRYWDDSKYPVKYIVLLIGQGRPKMGYEYSAGNEEAAYDTFLQLVRTAN